MSDPQLSPELIRFIQTTLPSYDAAVILVSVSRAPDRTWTAADLSAQMGVDPGSTQHVQQHLEDFARAGVLDRVEPDGFRLQPAGHESRTVVEELRMAYDRRPVTLIRAIDSAARAKIQSFADSFKLKRDRE
jgi:hypothetical protein